MKTTLFIKAVFFSLAVILVQSCVSTSFYQVYEVESEGLESSGDMVLFRNNECNIIYDFWGEAGSLDFVFKNNTDTDIYIDLSRSFFIRNGIAHDYFSDTEHTRSVTSVTGVSASLSKSYTQLCYELPMWTPTIVARGAQVAASGAVGTTNSITTKESRYICIPANSAKIIKGFSISDFVYYDCDNSELNTPRRASEHIEYTKEKSPLVFRNRVVYFVGDSEEGITVDNSFWVSGYTNYSQQDFFIKRREADCSNSITSKTVNIYKYQSATKFYNNYKSVGSANRPEFW